MVLVQFHDNEPDKIATVMDSLNEAFPDINSLLYTINQKKNDTLDDLEVICHSGNPFIEENIGELTFKIGPKSFFQTNTSQAKLLYEVVLNLAGLSGKECVYDLYSGTGTIALFLAPKAAKVVGLEYVSEAVQDAVQNARANRIEHAFFYAGDIAKVLNENFTKQHGQPDIIITDPPRAGMHQDVISMLLKLKAPKIIYVSCNPATQARDLSVLGGMYQLDVLQPVDMFPQTAHVESVALLTLK